MNSEARDDPELDLLVVECLERIEREGEAALETLCAENPQCAEALRTAVLPLLEFGALGATPSPAGPTPGTKIGDYEIVRKLGRGGMGVVYEARDPELERFVALKVLRSTLDPTGETRERFRREAAAAGGLRHENLVQVYGYGVHEQHPWLAMERVEGAPLDRVLERLRTGTCGEIDEAVHSVLEEESRAKGTGAPRRSPLAPRELRRRLELLIELAAGLQHVHDSGIVHRDVKPSNILVRRDGTPVLTDFGLAMRADLPGLTQDGAFAGTPFYASPEQATGRSRDVDAQSDVFSLGATLYELLTLQRPFRGETSRDVLRSIELREPEDPERLPLGIPRDVAAITMKALAKEKGERYASAAAFASDLRAFLELRPVSARRAGALVRVRRWLRREPLRAALLLVLLLAAIAVSGLGGYLLSQKPLIEAAEEQARLDAAAEATTRGFVEFHQRRRVAARASFARALELDPERVEAVVGAVMNEVTPRSGDAALELLQPWLEKEPDRQIWLRLQRLCLEQSGRDEESDEVAPKIRPPAQPMEYFLAANEKLREVVATDRESDAEVQRIEAEAQSLLVAAITSSPRPQPFHYYYACSLITGPGRDSQLARHLADSVTRLWPDAAFSWYGAGIALQGLDPARARACLERACALDPQEFRYVVGLAHLDFEERKLEEARRRLRSCLEEDPQHGGSLSLLAHVEAVSGDYDAALRHALAAKEGLADHDLAAWLRTCEFLCELRERRGEHDAAIALAREVLARMPEASTFRERIVNTLLAAGDAEGALAEVELLIAASPRNARNWSLKGQVLLNAGDIDAALAAMRKSCELAPEEASSWSNLAFMLLRSPSQGDEALAAARRAVRIARSRELRPTLILALVCLRTGRLQDAEHYARVGLELESLEGLRNAEERKTLEQIQEIAREKRARRR